MHQSSSDSVVAIISGPNWIHGTQNNPILDLARITGTALHSWDERQALYDRFGRIVPEEKVELLSGRLWGIIADAFKYSKEQSSSIPSDKSLLNFFEEKVKETRSKPAAGSTGKIEHDESAMLLQMAQIWGSFVGSPIAKQSLKFFWLEECIEGENLFVSGTYEKILAHVALPALERAEIQYNCNVVKIEAAGATESRQVRITTKSGQQMHFDHAVLTAPLGWLKRNTSAFEPPLPARIERAIDSISYGQLDKVSIAHTACAQTAD